jgi:hypothetical protein
VTTADDRLVAALTAEHAAIYGYGVVGAHLGGAVQLAHDAELAHRTRRDALVALLARHGLTPPAAQPVYALPFAVTDRAGAGKLAWTIEDRCAAIWREALPETTGDERKLALAALVDCATRATSFRRALGSTPVTTSFPGKI